MRILVSAALLAACGSGAAAGDASSGEPVTLTISDAQGPRAGVVVYFQSADSSLMTSMMTDATGTASARVPAGGFVTAVGASAAPGTTAFDELDTFASVQPGDHLVLTGAATAHEPITVHVTVPRDPAAGAGAQYALATSCGLGGLTVAASGPPSGSVALDACHGMADLLVTVTSTGGATDFFYAPDQVVSDGANLDLTAHGYTAAAPETFTLTDVGASTVGIELTTQVSSARGPLLTFGAAPSASSTWTAQLTVPTFPGAIHRVEIAPNNGGIATKHIDDWGPYTANYTVDVGARLLTDLATTAKFDPAAHALRWTEATGGAAPTAAFGVVSAMRGARAWRWSVVAPHDGASISFPVLPSTGFDYNIAAGDTPGFVSVQLASVSGGYDAWRTRPVRIGPNGKTVLDPVAGASGSASSEVSAQL
jgi:hypothetical protein